MIVSLALGIRPPYAARRGAAAACKPDFQYLHPCSARAERNVEKMTYITLTAPAHDLWRLRHRNAKAYTQGLVSK
ncbi:MAG TPA: hypothetical protein VF264_00475 [Rhodanobacteraceae bacterium]